MTISQALQRSVGYEIPQDNIDLFLLQRGLEGFDEAQTETVLSQDFQLAKADVCAWLFTVPNINDEGLQLSLTDKEKLLAIANGIYKQFGYPTIGIPVIRNRSNVW